MLCKYNTLNYFCYIQKAFYYIVAYYFNQSGKTLSKSYQKLHRVPLQFKRYLADQIDWNSRLIGIKGARGAGKTTPPL